eukprot:CAMPEP_0198289168 /NCGR_PEP_ID=MMETSP1449-20131203/7461_1 /TAXON_ID=420275 /ORGANISM="Attheya septentrionalis, Strain CCMP2084" /LENGTH=437 /DNA_ID=CAMNT_0043987465 /DNA_START=530 /DNA_END=1843 /DNA_ORIENTATION=-
MSSPQGNTGNKIYGTPTSVSRADVTLTPSLAVNTEHAKLEGDELPFKPPLKNASPKSSRFVLTSNWGRIVVPCMVMCLVLLFTTNQGQLRRESLIGLTSNVVVIKNTVLPQEEDGPWPKVAWLMSFPNSGTSYTMHMTQNASAQSVASNYGKEAHLNLSDGRINVPLFEDKPESPNLIISYPRLNMPTSYVLTKTHCGGYCMECGPDDYIETLQSFKRRCLLSHRYEALPLKKKDKLQQEKYRWVDYTYPEDMVKRAVHIIRDPFDNIVSRFHLHFKKKKRKWSGSDEEWDRNYPSNSTGFRNWCQYIDSKYQPGAETTRFLSDEVRSLFKEIPCHSDFYKYIQWHNLAVEVTNNNMDLPTHVVRYENYAKNFNQTLNELMGFLHLDIVGASDIPEFVPGRTYREYYTKKEKKAVLRLMKLIATKEAWDMMSTYNYV